MLVSSNYIRLNFVALVHHSLSGIGTGITALFIPHMLLLAMLLVSTSELCSVVFLYHPEAHHPLRFHLLHQRQSRNPTVTNPAHHLHRHPSHTSLL